MVQFLIIFLNFLISSLSANPCTFSREDFQITNFTDLYKNNFGNDQGVFNTELPGSYVRLSNESIFVNFAYYNDNYFYTKTYDPVNKFGFDVAEYSFLAVKVLQKKGLEIEISTTLEFVRDGQNCLDNSEMRRFVRLPGYSKDFVGDDNSIYGHYLFWKIDDELYQTPFSLCLIQLRVYPKGVPITISEISLVKVNPGCASPSQSISTTDFVYRDESTLMLKGSPFRFVGFFNSQNWDMSDAELEDYMRTVSVISKHSNPVIKIHPLISCIEDENYIIYFELGTCVLIEGEPRKYNESILVKVDKLLAVAEKHGVKVLIPFMERFLYSDAFSWNRNLHSYSEFYDDQLVIDDFRHFISFIVNRKNTITGKIYKNDAAIMGWVLGDIDLKDNFKPTFTWIRNITSHLKSEDPTHLVAHSHFLHWTFNYFDIVEIDLFISTSVSWIYKEYCTLPINLGKSIKRPIITVINTKLTWDAHGNYSYGIQTCYNRVFNDPVNSSFGFHKSPFAGAIVGPLKTRSEVNGFTHSNGFIYPQSKDDSNIQNMNVTIKIAAKLGGMYEWGKPVEVNSSLSLDYPPKLLKFEITYLGYEITFMGAAGALIYEISRSFDEGVSYTLLKNFNELNDDLYYIENSIGSDICGSVTYKITGSNEDKSILTPPLFYRHPLKPCFITSTTTSKNDATNRQVQPVLLIFISVVSSLLIALSIFLFKKIQVNRHRKPKDKSIKPFMPRITIPINIGRHRLMKQTQAEAIVYDLTKTFNVSRAISLPSSLMFEIVNDFRINHSSTSDNRTGGTSRILTATPVSEEAKSRLNEEIVAIKFFNDTESSDLIESDNFHYEVALMNSLPKSAPNLIKMLGFSPTERAIIMPFYEQSLAQLVRKNKFRLPPSKILKIASDIAEGMRVLHDEVRILHLDLKPGNILIDTVTNSNMPTCVICDFGYANYIGDDIPVVAGIRMPTAAGFTFAYAAPEILDEMFEKRYHSESEKPIDVYAYAMTMYEVLMQKYPWQSLNMSQIKANVMSGKRPAIEPLSRFEDIPLILEIIGKASAQNPTNRPSFKEICQLIKAQSMGPIQETQIIEKLKKEFLPTHISVIDISNGCGSMFNVEIESPRFKGKSLLQQHRLVQQCLSTEISQIHGINIKTKPSDDQ